MVRELVDELKYSFRPKARPYQVRGVEFLRESKRAILGDEAGLGKTRQLIEASEGETLVIAPAMVLAGGTWVDEIAKWADSPDRFTCVPYTSLQQREGNRSLQKLKPEYRRRWDTIICDESHYVKGRKSIRTNLVQQLAKMTDRIYLATGTPMPNWANEVFTLLQIIDPQAAAPGSELGSYWRWVENWFKVTSTRFTAYHVDGTLRRCTKACTLRPPTDPCEHYDEFAEANLRGVFLQRRRDDVLTDLPPLTEQSIETEMGRDQKAAYKAMKKDYVAENEEGEAVISWSSASRHVRMDRLTTGLDLLSDDIPETKLARPNNGKLYRLAEDLMNRSRPTLVMAHYRDTVEACYNLAYNDLDLSVEYIHGGVSMKERERIVRAFQAGELDVLVGSLETLAEGLTLTSADMVIFVEKSYKPSRNEQAMRRVHRLGQTRPVTVLDYVTPKSVDAGKRRLLANKTDGQVRALTAAQFLELVDG